LALLKNLAKDIIKSNNRGNRLATGMNNTSRLYETLVTLLKQSKEWVDIRHLYTLSWMVIGLMQSSCISLTQWGVYIHSRALFAQSRQRRFSRWLHNSRINVRRLYSPLVQTALSQWEQLELYLSIDTTMLWNNYCIIRIAVIYRGRAVPLAWRVLAHQSSSVAFYEYKNLLGRVARLLPQGIKVILLADRGFVDTHLMAHCEQLGWKYRIRTKQDFWVCRLGKAPCQVRDFHLGLGEAVLLQSVKVTKTSPYGPVSLALGRECINGELWAILSNETTTLQTFREYGLRFDIEENFLDDKSNGFQLESSEIRSAMALSRLCLVIAVATLFLTAQGTQVVAQGKRRWVDPHWNRGNSYMRIGWQWVKSALTNGWDLFQTLYLSGLPDPEPAKASRKQDNNKYQLEFTVRNYKYIC
jgi:hypothetical protein